jgi:hypothetical protein
MQVLTSAVAEEIQAVASVIMVVPLLLLLLLLCVCVCALIAL